MQWPQWPKDMFTENMIHQVLFASSYRWDSGDDAEAE